MSLGRWVALLGLIPALAWGQTLGLVWQFPREHTPQPTAFLVTYTGADGQTLDQMTTPPSAIGACARLGSTAPETYCTLWPQCPSAGVMTFWVQASWGATEVSTRTDPIALCLFTADKPCFCQDPGTYTPPPGGSPIVIPSLAATEIPPIQTVSLPAPPAFTPAYPQTPT